MRWLGFSLLAAGCVAAACWGPAQLWPTTAAPDGVYGRAGDGRAGFIWTGSEKVTRKTEWPTWTPPADMRAREAKKGKVLPVSMKGGLDNPLGSRALYLGSTIYRIHGTNEPNTIGQAVSSGCIRMTNDDVTDLYERVRVGAKVLVI